MPGRDDDHRYPDIRELLSDESTREAGTLNTATPLIRVAYPSGRVQLLHRDSASY